MGLTLTSIIKQILGYGCMRSQWLFGQMYLQSLRGMNYGNPHYWENGELNAIHYIAARLTASGQQNLIIFDVGANIGDYAKQLCHQFGGKAAIYCFEPSAASFKVLKENTNDIITITAHQFCFGDVEGTSTLFYGEPTSTIASLYDLPTNHPWKGDGSEQVEVKTMDKFCSQSNIEVINFLKVDVEGHELQVLQGAHEMLSGKKIDYIQFEFGFRQLDSRSYFRDFFDLLNDSYRIYRILKDGIYLIENYNENLEVFVGVSNFLAESRLLTARD